MPHKELYSFLNYSTESFLVIYFSHLKTLLNLIIEKYFV